MRTLKALVPAVAAVAILGGALLAGGTPAQAQTPARDQSEADIVYSPEREQYQLVWVEDRGAGNRIYAKRVHANGLPVGGKSAGDWELTAPTGVGAAAGQKGDQRAPAIIGDLVVWSEKSPGAADFDLYAQRLFDNGRASGKARLLLARPGDQMTPDVVHVSRGLGEEYLVVWSENTTDGGDVMGVRLSGSLAPRGAPFAVAAGQGRAEDPAIARDLRDDDSLLVLFTDDRAGNRDIYGIRILESGLPRGGAAAGDFPVIQTAADEYAPSFVTTIQPQSRAGNVREDKLLPNARGLVVWNVDDATNGPDVLGQRLFANGLPAGNAFAVAAGPGVQAMPAVTYKVQPGRSDDVEQAEWLAVWGDQSADVTGTLDVYGVEVQLNGITRRPERPLAAD